MFSTFTNSYSYGKRYFIINTPNALPNLQVSFNAGVSNTTNFNAVLTNGDDVGQWKDTSAGAHNANQSGNASKKPNWYSNIQNGLGAILFNGTSESMNINPVSFLQNSGAGLSGFSLYVVAKASSLSGTRPITGSDVDGMKIYYDGTNWGIKIASGVGTSSLVGDTTKFHVFSLIYDGTKTGNANRARFRYDGVEQTLTYSGTVGATTNGAITKFFVGEDGKTPTSYFSGYIAEMIMFSRTNTSTEIPAIEGYLKATWGL